MEILKYVLHDVDDNLITEYEFDTVAEAKEAAQGRDGEFAVIERTYTYDDSALVWSSTGDNSWPPPPADEEDPHAD